MPYLFTNEPLPNVFGDFYTELEGYLDGIVAGVIPDTSITNAKLATDIKVGSLATLTTTHVASVVGAINEVKALADTAIQSDTAVDCVKKAKITLNGGTYTPVVFGSATAATVTSTVTEPFDLTGVGDGGTILLNPDGKGQDTATVNFTAGTSLSGESPSTDISAGVDKKFNISVDGDVAEEVELTLAGLNSGAGIAAAMEAGIRALGGSKASVTVTYNAGASGKYLITSATSGTGSSVVITEAADFSITEELKIGTVAGGIETAGTGDVANAAAATAAEIAAVINTDIAGVEATVSAGKVVITSDTTGASSTLVFGDSTLKTAVGFANALTAYGAEGLGLTDMADADYAVAATLTGASNLAGKCLSINSLTTTGFRVYCETAAATDDVFLIITGTSA